MLSSLLSSGRQGLAGLRAASQSGFFGRSYMIPTLMVPSCPPGEASGTNGDALAARVVSIQQHVEKTVAAAPTFYAGAPLVVDFSSAGKVDSELASAVLSLCNTAGLLPIAVRGLGEPTRTEVHQHGFPSLTSSGGGGSPQRRNVSATPAQEVQEAPAVKAPTTSSPRAEIKPLYPRVKRGGSVSSGSPSATSSPPTPPPPPRSPPQPNRRSASKTSQKAATVVPPVMQNVLIPGSVRSGQLVQAPHGSVTVLGSVSPGAEIMAAGDVNVYGRLGGRVLAGSGVGRADEARIVAGSFDAEIVAIGDVYQVCEETPEGVEEGSVTVVTKDPSTESGLCFSAFGVSPHRARHT